tara:strand:+ start:1650 stop:1955 length:306 start_codon:yes stop_codon:yes gene_type:complete
MKQFLEKPEIEIYVDDIWAMDVNNLNSSELRNDLMCNHIVGCVLRLEGYVGNRPSDCDDDEHEDDTWSIDIVSQDGAPEISYLYTSNYEYNQDYEILKVYS